MGLLDDIIAEVNQEHDPEVEQRARETLAGSAGDVPLGSVFTPELGQRYEPPEMVGDVTLPPTLADDDAPGAADMWTMFKAGHLDNPVNQIPIYAASRFPDLPLEESLKRYGVHEGEVVFQAEDGKVYRETPDTIAANLKRMAAQTGSHWASILGGLSGLAVGGPFMGFTGAAGGEGARQYMAEKIWGEKKDPMSVIIDMGREGIMFELGEVGGRVVSRGMTRAGLKRGGPLAPLMGEEAAEVSVKATREAERRAAEAGLTLPAPATTTLESGLPSSQLLGRFAALGSYPPTSVQVEAVRRSVKEQVEDSLTRFLDDISPFVDPRAVGTEARDASVKAMEKLRASRKARTGPLFKRAFKEGAEVDVQGLRKRVNMLRREVATGTPAHTNLNRIEKMLRGKPVRNEAGKIVRYETVTDLKKLDSVRKHLGRITKGAAAEWRDPELQQIADELRRMLTTRMREASPVYAKALDLHGEITEETIQPLVKSAVGGLRRMEGDELVTATRRLLKSTFTSPANVRYAKEIIKDVNPDAWNMVVRNFIEQEADMIRRSTKGVGNLPGDLFDRIFAQPKQRKLLMEALEPYQYRNLKNFMGAMQDAARLYKGVSSQQLAGEMMGQMRKEAEARLLTTIATPLRTPQRFVVDVYNEARMGRYSREVLDILMDKRNVKTLRKIKQMKPWTRPWLRAMGALVSQSSLGEMRRTRDRRRAEDVPIPALGP